jgi:hypothetical protein
MQDEVGLPIDTANVSPAALFTQAAELFNVLLRNLEEQTNFRANFKWTYNHDGRKELVVTDVSEALTPSADTVAKAQSEVPGIMEQAEELVGKPVEIAPNAAPGPVGS